MTTNEAHEIFMGMIHQSNEKKKKLYIERENQIKEKPPHKSCKNR